MYTVFICNTWRQWMLTPIINCIMLSWSCSADKFYRMLMMMMKVRTFKAKAHPQCKIKDKITNFFFSNGCAKFLLVPLNLMHHEMLNCLALSKHFQTIRKGHGQGHVWEAKAKPFATLSAKPKSRPQNLAFKPMHYLNVNEHCDSLFGADCQVTCVTSRPVWASLLELQTRRSVMCREASHSGSCQKNSSMLASLLTWQQLQQLLPGAGVA